MKTPSFRNFLLTLAVVCSTALTGVTCTAAPRAVAAPPEPFPKDPGHVTGDPDNQLPLLIDEIHVTYPADMLANPEEDRVWVAFIVDRNGTTQKVRAFFGQKPKLEQAAVAAVEHARFTPGVHNGQTANTQMIVLVRFEVDS